MRQRIQDRSKRNLILASASPRRASILKSLHIEFSVRESRIEEKRHKGESPESFAIRIAQEKARCIGTSLKEGIVIGCDTIVTINNRIFGKPENPKKAMEMLKVLSGRWHKVISGLSLYNAKDGRERSGFSMTAVKFLPLQPREIAWYIRSMEPWDKAGGYGIQGLGRLFIEKIRGSYTNVVGLPIELLKELMEKMGIDFLSLIRKPP